jgi:diguanylate cyclase (GGDEF)-like protein
MIIDFDHFKNLNDTHGHHVGDTVLESGAQLMKSLVSPPSAVGRWGGEEFIVICACATAKEAAHLGETIRAEIFKKIGPEVDFPVSITAGIAQIRNDETTDGCIKRADEALYQGKQNGRNRVEVAQANQA